MVLVVRRRKENAKRSDEGSKPHINKFANAKSPNFTEWPQINMTLPVLVLFLFVLLENFFSFGFFFAEQFITF